MTETLCSEKLLSTKEAAEVLGLSPLTLRNSRLYPRKQSPLSSLPTVKIGRSVRYRQSDVLALIENSVVEPKEFSIDD